MRTVRDLENELSHIDKIFQAEKHTYTPEQFDAHYWYISQLHEQLYESYNMNHIE